MYMPLTYSCLIKRTDLDLEYILAAGILIINNSTTPSTPSSDDVYVECAAPILRSIMIARISGPTPKISKGPITTNILDTEWLLARTIEVGNHAQSMIV